MKKSFLYVVPAALILALLFAGCPQDSDDDGDSGGVPSTVPVSDLSYIAYAFGEGINTVRAINDISLGKQELVIPEGKTLDLASSDVTLGGLDQDSKIIALGTILFSSAQNIAGGVDFTKYPNSAKIIAGKDFINNNVWIDYEHGGFEPSDWEYAGITDKPAGKPKAEAVIWANWEQIVIIEPIGDFKNHTGDDDKPYLYGDYLAIKVTPEGIGGIEARLINEKAKGLNLYLVGDPVIFNSLDRIDIAGSKDMALYKAWKPIDPDNPDSSQSVTGTQFNMTTDNGGLLVVAGNADVHRGQITAPGGFTVWGVLKNQGESTDTSTYQAITTGETPFTALTTRLKGASFGGPVLLLGSIENTFGPSVKFEKDVKITGPSTFSDATFNDTSKFNGTIKVKGKGIFGGTVSFADYGYLKNDTELKVDAGNEAWKNVFGLNYETYNKINYIGGGFGELDLTTIDTSGAVPPTFKKNVAFSKPVNIGTEAVFEKDVTFKAGATFTKKPTFGTVSGNTTGGTSSTTIIKGSAVFEDGADFGGTLNSNQEPVGNAVIIEEAKFNKGTFENITDLKLGNSESPAVVFTAGAAADSSGSGAITIPSGGGIEFKDNTLTFTGDGGTLGAAVTLNNATIKLDSTSAKVVFNQSNYPIEVMRASGTGSGGFEIIGKAELNAGVIKGLSDGVAVKASGEIILTVPDVHHDYSVITVNNALVDLSSGGTIVFAGTASRVVLRDNANIKLHGEDGGLAIPKGKTISEAVITAGNSGGSAALLTGSFGVDKLANGLVGTRAGGTYGSITDAWTTPWSNILDRTNSFILVGTQAVAGSISAGTNPGSEQGSIAVFTSQGSF
jgi:hypothetical protein